MPKKTQKQPGRPTKMTELTVKKLEEAFSLGSSDEEACFYAGISKQTLYDYQKKVPSFIDRKELLKKRPVLMARRSVVEGLEEDPYLSLKFLERKRKKEFGLKQEVEHSGKIDHKISAKDSLLEKLKDVVSSKNN